MPCSNSQVPFDLTACPEQEPSALATPNPHSSTTSPPTHRRVRSRSMSPPSPVPAAPLRSPAAAACEPPPAAPQSPSQLRPGRRPTAPRPRCRFPRWRGLTHVTRRRTGFASCTRPIRLSIAATRPCCAGLRTGPSPNPCGARCSNLNRRGDSGTTSVVPPSTIERRAAHVARLPAYPGGQVRIWPSTDLSRRRVARSVTTLTSLPGT